MFSSLRSHFGIPGVVAVIALVFAMMGGAYAATNGPLASSSKSKKGKLTKRQKKEVEKIARKSAKPGPAGPQGPAGAKGDSGANGSAGGPGQNGANGKSVTVTKLEPEIDAACNELGGVIVEKEGESSSAAEVCNGEPGVIHPGETLPEGASETGAFTAGTLPSSGEVDWVSISFNIPLASDIPVENAHFINAAGNEIVLNEGTFEAEALSSHPDCPGTATDPIAAEGNLCVYTAEESGFSTPGAFGAGIFGAKPGGTFSSFHNAESGGLASFGASKVGASVEAKAKASGAFVRGTWAVTG